jgi:hypothetical protein
MVNRRATRLAVFLLVMLALVSAPVLAQTTPATIKGTVVDKDGDPLPGATVTLENPSLGVKGLGGITNAQGEFRITVLQPGKGYVLQVSMPAHQKIVSRDIEIPAGRTIVHNVTLRPELTEIVRVQGKEEMVNSEKVSTSTTISSEFISGLPVLGRDYQDVLTLAPGVTDVNGTGNPNIHGARDTDVVTLVDGVSTTDPFSGQFGQNLNVESIEEIEVITSGASAEFSRAQGGFVKIITKSGGNEFKGTFKFAMRTNKLDGDGAGIDSPDLRGGLGESAGFRDTSFTDLYPFISVSGAFIKDHLWYYFAPEYSQEETPINAGTQAYVQSTKSYRVTGKVTWQVASNNKLAFTVLWDDEKNYNLGLDSIHDLNTAFTFGRGGPTLTLQDNALLSPNLSLESTISRFDQKFFVEPSINPDTNGNGILTIDDQPQFGGNEDGFISLRESADPGYDTDADGAFDVFEDYNHNEKLDGCVTDENTGVRTCSEDRDRDGRLTLNNACEGPGREDVNCDGYLNSEMDANNDGIVDPLEDTGIPCTNVSLCIKDQTSGLYYEKDANGNSTRGNGILDTEDKNGNQALDDDPFPNWHDSNGNGIPDRGEFTSPLAPDQQYVLNFNTNRWTGPYFFNNNDTRTRDSLKEDLSYYIDDLLGSHDIKAGASFEREGYHSDLQQRAIWQIQTGAIDQNTGQIGGTIAAYLPTQQEAINSAASDNMGFYIHDNYKPLPNLTFGLGIRFDREAVSSHGYELFDPAQQRAEFDLLQGLKGSENGSDINNDGVVTKGLEGDPLYGSNLNSRVSQLNSALGLASYTRFTRHNYQTSIESGQIGDPLMLKNGRPRQPEDFTVTNNNLAPRLSVSWDPWADGKSKATAAWGRFYDKLFLQSVIYEEGPDLLSPYYGYDTDGVDFFGLPDNKVGKTISKSPPSAYQIDRGMRTPFTDEFTIGFQREVAPEVSISINYIQRKYRDQLQDIDVNHNVRKPGNGVNCNTTPSGYCDDFGLTRVPPPQASGQPKPDERVADQYPDLYINNYNFNQVLRIGNYNYQEYVGYELALSRRLSRKWQMDVNYTFSKATGQAESFNSQSGDDPALTELKSGYLDYDQTHVAKFYAIAYLPKDWQFGGGITWASGLPWSNINRFRSSDNVDFPQIRRLYGYIEPNSGHFLEENRNIHRNHAAYEVDLRTEKRFVIGQITAGAFFEVFNLLNSDDLRVFEIDTSFDTLQSTEQREFGRRFQFGVHMDF